MATSQTQSAQLRATLAAGTATSAAVTTLQSLLASETNAKESTTSKTTTSKAKCTVAKRAGVATKTGLKTASRAPAILVHEDEARSLPPKDRYALATEVVNITLKVLTESLKNSPRTSSLTNRDNALRSPATPKSSRKPSVGVLQPRSGNETPVRLSPRKEDSKSQTPNPKVVSGPAPAVQATAECSRLAFSYLRSANTQKLGVRDLPNLQLENGMLALASRLVSHDLESLASKELRILKHRLESLGSTKKPVATEKETLAGLLRLELDLEKQPQLLPLATSYHSLVLRVIASSSKPASIESCVEYLDPALESSPSNYIAQQGKASGDTARTGRMLESLSSTILSMCPSVNTSADAVAMQRNVHAPPNAIFKLQVIALKLRRQWWALVGHKADVERELLDPMYRCLIAFVRRSATSHAPASIYEDAQTCTQELLQELEKVKSKALFVIHRTLCNLAKSAVRVSDALTHADSMSQQSEHLEPNHAQRVAVLVCRISLICESTAKEAMLLDLVPCLKSNMAGSSGDYEYLLRELASLLPRLSSTSRPCEAGSAGMLGVAASFAQRFMRSYPRRGMEDVQTILHCALRQTYIPEEALSWITPDAAMAFIANGALRTASEAARTQPTNRAWSADSSTLTLARILRLLTTKAIKSGSATSMMLSFADEKLGSLELGLILEMQITTAIEHASRTKYHAALKKLLPDLFSKLNQVYPLKAHPIRRASVAVQIMRLHETCPELVPPHLLSSWKNQTLDSQDFADDELLGSYASDLNAALCIVKLFLQGEPSLEKLRPRIQAWVDIVNGSQDRKSLENSIYDLPSLGQLLKAVASFLGAIGAGNARLSALMLLSRFNWIRNAQPGESLDDQVSLAMQWLDLGFVEKASSCLAQAQTALENAGTEPLCKIQYHLASAQCSLRGGDRTACIQALARTQALREALPAKAVSKTQRSAYERMHAQGWLLHSAYSLESGAPHEALASAKHTVKILNSAWHRLEKGSASDLEVAGSDDVIEDTTAVNQLTTGVSKLRLESATRESEEKKPNTKGAAFWPLIPLLCKALTHLSDMYAHHGLYSEASYYSSRAIEIGESVGASVLLSRVRSHRALLLCLADQLEEADLCLTAGEDIDLSAEPLALAERLRAEAAIRAKENSFEEAVKLYSRAESLISNMQTLKYAVRLGGLVPVDNMALEPLVETVRKPTAVNCAGIKPKRAIKLKTTTTRKAPASAPALVKAQSKITVESGGENPSFLLLDKVREDLRADRILAITKSGRPESTRLDQMSLNATSKQRQVECYQRMQEAEAAMETDITYNILPESTLSFPAVVSEPLTVAAPKPAKTSKTISKPLPRKALVVSGFNSLLQQARTCLSTDQAVTVRQCTTAEIHSEGSLMSGVSILLSASNGTMFGTGIHPVQSSFTLDFPRNHALQCEQTAAAVDIRHEKRSMPFEWPSPVDLVTDPIVSASDFQTDYIDIIPTPWTAVSLSLNSNGDTLYVTRYRANQSPFILRLPFARHQTEEDAEAFDYNVSKAELADIIQLSNYSCHNNGDMSSKTAKSGWWSEREALDRRLQELLINVEDIWLGGFKGVLSPRQSQVELLAKFRKAFTSVLDRHLPSRQNNKGKGKPKKLSLDDHVLELFINLGGDNDGTIDLDEPISDLLYFVVDMLQFNGERNAYDEVDFDTMAVEVLDALRSYHEACDEQEASNGHVVFVLDKRLQAFPWENLPCLEGVSVSRVGSMLSLRECILAMRLRKGHHTIPRRHGSYILNPSSDLASTQSALEPALIKAATGDRAAWKSFVKQAPTEDEFKATLESSAITLYFGHGAGSQYIRPRTIKKLDSCSEVVWLMGCSSGAVTEYGQLEPQAVPLAYLMAGAKNPVISEDSVVESSGNSKCFSVLATLWDVTDKDIDRFSLAVGEDWGLWPSALAESSSKLPAKTPRKRERLNAAPSTPPRVPKTPKTPKTSKTPLAAKTPKRDTSRVRKGGLSLGEAVAKSRDACYLRYLNGAAPVVYGVPVYLGD